MTTLASLAMQDMNLYIINKHTVDRQQTSKLYITNRLTVTASFQQT